MIIISWVASPSDSNNMEEPGIVKKVFIMKKIGLYKKLVAQLNKDFLLANIDLDFDEDILPSSLKLILHETLYHLIQEKFADYLNLLYIIDVPERNVKQLDGSDIVQMAEQVSFLILLRFL